MTNQAGISKFSSFFMTVQLFLEASSQINLLLGVDFAQVGCNQKVKSSYNFINFDHSGGYNTPYSGSNTPFFFFWHLHVSQCLLSCISCLKDILSVS